jgi:hypothetical protein
MRALKGFRIRLALILCGLAAFGLSGSLVATAEARCVSDVRGEPCLGPIHSSYNFVGMGAGKLASIWAKLGSQEEIGRDSIGNPIWRRAISWHSKANVKIVAVFIATSVGRTGRRTFRRVPTGEHSGHTQLTMVFTHNSPLLLLQGRH